MYLASVNPQRTINNHSTGSKCDVKSYVLRSMISRQNNTTLETLDIGYNVIDEQSIHIVNVIHLRITIT